MDADREVSKAGRFAARRKHAGTRPGVRPRCATLAAWGEAHIYKELTSQYSPNKEIQWLTDINFLLTALRVWSALLDNYVVIIISLAYGNC